MRIQGLSWNLSLLIPFSCSARQLSQGLCLHFPSAEIRGGLHGRPAFVWVWGVGPHACVAHTFPALLSAFAKLELVRRRQGSKPELHAMRQARPVLLPQPRMVPNVSLVLFVHKLGDDYLILKYSEL